MTKKSFDILPNFLRKEKKTDWDPITLQKISEFILHEFDPNSKVTREEFMGNGIKGQPSSHEVLKLRIFYIYLACKYTSESFSAISDYAGFSKTYTTNAFSRDKIFSPMFKDMENVFKRKFKFIEPVPNWEDRFFIK